VGGVRLVEFSIPEGMSIDKVAACMVELRRKEARRTPAHAVQVSATFNDFHLVCKKGCRAGHIIDQWVSQRIARGVRK
jgi:hypothetical protein